MTMMLYVTYVIIKNNNNLINNRILFKEHTHYSFYYEQKNVGI